MRKRGNVLIFEASITVETALIMPVFLFVVFAFLSFYRILEIEEVVHQAAVQAAKEFSLYGFMSREPENGIKQQTQQADNSSIGKEESDCLEWYGLLKQFLPDIKQLTTDVLEAAFIKTIVTSLFSVKNVGKGWIKGGNEGIIFMGSHLLQDGYVKININYHITFPIFERLLPAIPVEQRVTIKSFTGYQPEKSQGSNNDDEEIVYITETGNVYHIKRDCTYIKLSIKSIPVVDISDKRNENGGKYYPCGKCDAKDCSVRNVYITSYGENYHSTLSCSFLKRTVKEIRLSEVGDRKPCKKCGTKE